MARHFWQILQAITAEELLFHCQTIITAIRLWRLVNLHLGITLWQQGEQPVLCFLPVCHTHHIRSRSCSGCRGRSEAVRRLTWPPITQAAFSAPNTVL